MIPSTMPIIVGMYVQQNHLLTSNSFSTENKGYDAFNEFLHLFGASVEINSVSQLVSINRVGLYFAWVNNL